MIRSSRTRFFMNLLVRFNIAKNTRHYLTPKSLSPKRTVHSKYIICDKKKVPPCPEIQGPFVYWCSNQNDPYSTIISGVAVSVPRWMLFVSFLRHSPSHFPEGNLVICIFVLVMLWYFHRAYYILTRVRCHLIKDISSLLTATKSKSDSSMTVW